MGARSIWLEGDSMCVVNWIISRRGSNGYADTLIQDMVIWIGSIEEFWCSHIMREGNMAMDYITDIGLKGMAVQYMKNFLPEELREILYEKRLESCIRRA